MPTWEEDIVSALTSLGGTGTYAEIYDAVKTLRTDLPASWKDIIRRQIQDRSSDSAGYKNVADVFFSVEGLGRGVWGLRQLVQPTPTAADLPEGNDRPGRVRQATYRILRDTVLARQIKLLHRDACQICGEVLHISPTKTYSEAHHIIPLGGDHAGPDTASNVIVLCPNHHALCDMGAIALRREDIRVVEGHVISEVSLKYHNEQIFGRIF
ncbi:HNH endonuclease [Actinoplanes sp. NEAU-A12]|uniref:HNH endonuclease n=1 Tax=Actinoplanes sandaracinus TaxID=3045177 RepID=A0ABT6WU95_9ACTN|nr:HNH endonuclease [Actinoplanes sandaracinus]MDI6103314.1 HNH endonuclease [Actinoplanes sandaracinus]